MSNSAPEKIYFDGESKACKLPIFSSQNIEYTRTDIFIEKAYEYLNKSCRRFILTEKDIEEFKSYMKGE